MTPRKAKKPKSFIHFETTVPVLRPCKLCGVWLAAGVAEGMHVLVDLVQLDQTQVVLAMLAGLRIFSLRRIGLVQLDHYRMDDPAFPGRLPEHRCGVSWPRNVPGAGSIHIPSHDEIPPY